MQMNEQVLTALEVLRNFAENDFERHRIDVLEKDLTEPPKVEIIDETHQKFNGIVFTKHKLDNHYNLTAPGIQRAVWKYYNGEIPQGYEIHHRNLNPADNAISNLQMLTSEEHARLHRKLDKKIFVKCIVCGEFFETRSRKAKYCSAKCKSHFQHKKNPPKKILTTCVICGKNFETNKYRPSPTCSKSCTMKLAHQHKGDNFKTSKGRIPRNCPICGITFVPPYYNNKTKTCSQSCGAKWRVLQQKLKVEQPSSATPDTPSEIEKK